VRKARTDFGVIISSRGGLIDRRFVSNPCGAAFVASQPDGSLIDVARSIKVAEVLLTTFTLLTRCIIQPKSHFYISTPRVNVLQYSRQ
jgi:hypothetical protein